MTIPTREMRAVTHLLEGVWFAKGKILDDGRPDWKAIDLAYSSIVPSDSEAYLVGIAKNLWNGFDEINLRDALDHFDDMNFARLLTALKILRGWE
jgi:hypothetical protein